MSRSRTQSPRMSPAPSASGKSSSTERNQKRAFVLSDCYCWRCHDTTNGEFDFCCQKCRRSFHYLHCKRPPKVCGTDPLHLGHFKLAPTETLCPQCQHEAEAIRKYAKADLREMNRAIANAVELMKEADRDQYFWIGVCEKMHSNLRKFVINPMDLSVMARKAELALYTCPEQFLSDAKMILHNCLIVLKRLNSTNVASEKASELYKLAWDEFTRISYCYGCYLRTLAKPDLNKTEDFLTVCHSPRPHGLVWAHSNLNSTFLPAKIIKFVDNEKNPTVDICFFGETREVITGVKLSNCFAYSQRRPTKEEFNEDNINTEPVPPSAFRELDIYLNALKAQHYEVESPDYTILTRERVYMARNASFKEDNNAQNNAAASVPALGQNVTSDSPLLITPPPPPVPESPSVVVPTSVPMSVSNPTLATTSAPTSTSHTRPPNSATTNSNVNINQITFLKRHLPGVPGQPFPSKRPTPQAPYMRIKQEIVDDDECDNKADVARAISAASLNAPLRVISNSLGSGTPGTSRTVISNSLPPSTSTVRRASTDAIITSSRPPSSNITNNVCKRKVSSARGFSRATPNVSGNRRPQVPIRAESTTSLSSVGTFIESVDGAQGGDGGVSSRPSRQLRSTSPGPIFSTEHIHRELERMIKELHRDKDESLSALSKKVAKLTTENTMARAILNDEELRISGKFCRKCYKTVRLTNCCSTVYYCSSDCQHADWRSHTIDCKRVKPNTVNENIQKH